MPTHATQAWGLDSLVGSHLAHQGRTAVRSAMHLLGPLLCSEDPDVAAEAEALVEEAQVFDSFSPIAWMLFVQRSCYIPLSEYRYAFYMQLSRTGVGDIGSV